MTDVPFFTDNAAFSDYCQTLQQRKVIALDTEFLRVNTFYPKPGLFQINDGERIVLVDPCAITAWEGFCAVLVDPAIVKVLHACDEDIELLYHFLNVEPVNVFDTQVAAAFCGYDYCMGYQRLLKAMLDIDLEKGHSRSDWMQRPLDPDQLRYAVDDVLYLLPVYEKLACEIASRGLESAIIEEYQSVIDSFTSADFGNAWQRVKEAWRLNPRQFAVLKALATWREEKMRQKNLPRKRIADDGALMTLASRSQWSVSQLFDVQGLPAFTVRAEGEALVAMIEKVSLHPCEQLAPKPPKPDGLYGRLRKQLERQAHEFGVDEKMLSKKQYNELLYSQLVKGCFELPASISGWRRPLYQQAVSALQQG